MSIEFVGKSKFGTQKLDIRFIGKSEFSNLGNFIFVGKSKFSVGKEISFLGKSRFRTKTRTFNTTVIQPRSETPLPVDFDTSSIKVGYKFLLNYKGASYNITSYVKNFTFNKRLNEDISWTMELANPSDREFSPDLTTADFYRKLGINNFYEGELIRWIKYTVLLGDTYYYSGKLIIQEDVYDTKTRTRNIAGGSILSRLYKSGENMDPWVKKGAKKIISDILTEYGITNMELNFTDYTVKNYDFVEATPIDKVKELVSIGMANFHMEGDKFIASNDPTMFKNPDKVYADRLNILDLKKEQSLNDYYNEINIGREKPIEGMCVIEGQQWGFNRVDLCMPLLNPYAYVDDAKSGSIVMIFFGNNSNGIEQQDNYPVDEIAPDLHWGYTGPATWISFWYKQREGMQVVGNNLAVGYRIIVRGTRSEELDSESETIDSNFNFHYVDEAEQNGTIDSPGFGQFIYPSFFDNSLIPNSEWAEDLAVWLVDTHIRNRDRLSLVVPFDTTLEPGDVISVTDYGTGMNKMKYFVHSVSNDFLGVKNSISAVRLFL